MKEPVGVSLCLLGVPCRYNGGHKRMTGLERFLESFSPVPFCPEQLAGLPTPRPPAQFHGGDGYSVLEGKARVINQQGEDVTEIYISGCERTLHLVKLLGLKRVFLKEKSPCCGVSRVWIENRLTEGSGILVALIRKELPEVEIVVGDSFNLSNPPL